MLKRGLHKVYGTWFLTVFAALGFTSLCLIAVIPGQARRRRIAGIGAAGVFRLTGANPAIQGLERLPEGPSVVVANHASYLDGILLTAVLPHRYRFVIKKEITQVPLVSFFLKRIGAHFVERFDPKRSANDARRIMQTAVRGESLAFFPEGTFRREAGLRRFHNGAFTIATRNNLPLVPLTISGTRQMLPAGEWLPAPGSLRVSIAPPLDTSGAVSVAEALKHCRTEILNSLEEPDLLDTKAD